jgi:N-acetylglutamate synthase-like GNAT family acetyltransferase
MISVRNATESDSDAIEKLIGQLGYSVSSADVAARLATIESVGNCVLVAEIDGQVVGCLSTSTMTVLHRPAPVGRISMMVVDERYRSRGTGAEMVKAAERMLAEKGCQLVEVTSNLRRTDAHRFWKRIGYERTSARFAKDAGEIFGG